MSLMSLIVLLFYCNCSNVFLQSKLIQFGLIWSNVNYFINIFKLFINKSLLNYINFVF